MNLRAAIFDIYGTLLEVGPPPADAEARWSALCRDLLGCAPRLSRLDFSIAANRVVARHHAAAKARGIRWPEVHWPSVVAEVLPEVARLPEACRDEFILRQVQTGHTTRLKAETAAMLRQVKARPCLVGIASNAQSYSVRELAESLALHGLDLSLFEPDLCFWSFEHGFSKPDPHVFQILTARLAARGVAPEETLMVGDRLDNDITPALAHGWQAWHFAPGQAAESAGDWAAQLRWLDGK